MREKDDFYPTPPAMTEALLAYEFLEPCRVQEPDEGLAGQRLVSSLRY